MACTIDCLSKYGCGQITPIEEGAIFSPYVSLFFGSNNLTVGNNSQPPVNLAAITSFNMGFGPGTSGWGASFEIVDSGGATYPQIIQALNKTVADAGTDAQQTDFDFGWIIKNCDGRVSMKTAKTLTGMKFHGIFTGVEQNFSGGNVKLKFEIKAPNLKSIPESRQNETIGVDKVNQRVPLRQALTQLFTQYNPKFASVQFKGRDGGALNFKASDGGADGPLGAWPMDQQNLLAIARKWLGSITTFNNLGILILYDSRTNGIVFQEDPNEPGKCCSQNVSTLYPNVGTYIWNGGNCSPVLDFNPTIKWPATLIPGAGAATGGAASAGGTPITPKPGIQNAGSESSVAVQQNEWSWRTPDQLAAGAANGFSSHLAANQVYELPGWDAELKIIGDPTYCDLLALTGTSVSVLVVNPFYIGETCKWITSSNCNPTMSNKNYMILGVAHQISGGSFVTTLKLKLLQPNKDIPANDPLGGCGTTTFNNPLGAAQGIPAEAK